VIVDLVPFILVSDVARSIAFFRRQLQHRGIEPGELEEGPGPGPTRQLCVRDPDGHRHVVAELFDGSVGSEPPR
jgi:hypothetical protein